MLCNLRISTKLLIGFGIMLLLLLGVGATGFWGVYRVIDATHQLEDQIIAVEQAGSMDTDMLHMRRYEKDILINIENPDKVAEYKKKFDGEAGNFRTTLDKVEKLIDQPQEKALLDEIRKNGEAYIKGFSGVYERIRSGELATAAAGNTAIGEFKTFSHKAEKGIEEYLVELHKQEKAIEQAVESTKKASITILSILIAVAAAIAIALAMLISRAITVPLGKLARDAETLADGNLNVHVACTGNDEIGALCSSFARMTDNLRETIQQINETSQQVASSAVQLHATADQIATGAEEVAAQSGTVATASEEMSATSGDIARNCLMAAEASNRASETARTGSTVVQETINGMQRIAGQVRAAARTVGELGARSDQIGAIIGTIEDIADQTNLLALNAAIEAARAGEQGRGFAVVADEVRALAERTTRATREIGEMIKAIQQETRGAVAAMEEGVGEVERGTASSVQSGEALAIILDQINDVTQQINQIATAAEEQTATTNEITSNIHQITEVVGTTSNGAAQTADASSELSRESDRLQQLVHRFRL